MKDQDGEEPSAQRIERMGDELPGSAKRELKRAIGLPYPDRSRRRGIMGGAIRIVVKTKVMWELLRTDGNVKTRTLKTEICGRQILCSTKSLRRPPVSRKMRKRKKTGVTGQMEFKFQESGAGTRAFRQARFHDFMCTRTGK